MSRIRIGLLANPQAAKGKAGSKIREVRSLLQQAGFSIVDLSADDAKTAYLRGKKVLSTLGAVVAVGGDGTVALAASLVAGTEVKLGIVPLGSGNDFARAVGIEVKNVAAAVQLIKCRIYLEPNRVDALLLRPDYALTNNPRLSENSFYLDQIAVLGNISCGVDAIINRRANRKKQSYTIAALAEIAKLKTYRYRLSIDGGPAQELSANLLTICNSGTFGGGMKISPNSDLQDGKFEIATVSPVSRLKLLLLFPLIFTGKHQGLKIFSTRQASNLQLELVSKQELMVTSDGEERCLPPIKVEIQAGAVCLLADPKNLQPTKAHRRKLRLFPQNRVG